MVKIKKPTYKRAKLSDFDTPTACADNFSAENSQMPTHVPTCSCGFPRIQDGLCFGMPTILNMFSIF